MTAPKWWEGRLTGFDTEATGTDVHTDRIVQASLVFAAPGQRPKTLTWLIDPGTDIPAEAAEVHGWTRDKILTRVGGEHMAVRITHDGRELRMTRDGALFELAGQLGTAIHTETPIVAANAAYDMSLLEAELARNQVDTLASRPDGIRGVVDPMVIDTAYDQYRKSCYKKNPATGETCDRENKVHVCGGCRGGRYQCGGCGSTDRTLGSLCAHYGIFLGSAHEATADALAAVRLAVKLAGLWPEIARWKLGTLHQHQVTWRREQQASLRKFFTQIGKTEEAAGICPEWPVHVACAPHSREVA